MQRPRRALLVGLPVMFVAGCSLVSPAPYTGTTTHPSGAEVVVRVEWTGGFVPYEWIFSSLPRFTLLGDGRVLVEGPQIDIYPGPALPNVQVRRLTEEGIQSVLYRVGETGLFGASQSFNAAFQFVADANTTVFTVNAADREVVVDVYALGILTDTAGGMGDQVSEEERAAHRTLSSLEADLMNLDAWIPADDWADAAWQPYQADALRLLVANVDGEPPNPDGLDAEPRPWPGSTPPEQLGTASDVQNFRCGAVTGEEAAAWLTALESANQLTRWSSGDHLYRVTPRPLLPDEPLDCGPSTF